MNLPTGRWEDKGPQQVNVCDTFRNDLDGIGNYITQIRQLYTVFVTCVPSSVFNIANTQMTDLPYSAHALN